MKKCLYAATLDPITTGHHWIIEEAHELFDEVVVAVGFNPDKKGSTLFDVDERVRMVKESCFGLDDVSVTSYSGEFTVRFAEAIGATHLVRGIRNEADFGSEQAIRHVNQDICPKVKTVFMVPPRNLSEVSSSMVKGLVGFRGWRKVVDRYVKPCVVKRFQAARLGAAEVMERLGAEPSAAKAAEEFLQLAYLQDRHYHGIGHVESCLGLLRMLVSDRMVSPDALDQMAAAIWFHDCVYDAKSNCNEERSADAFQGFSAGIDSGVAGYIKGMIRATRTHDDEVDYPAMLVNDIDMAILGADEREFYKYEGGIRTEYRHVPKQEFFKARKELLQWWLAKGVYKTKFFKAMFDDKARRNIERLLATSGYS